MIGDAYNLDQLFSENGKKKNLLFRPLNYSRSQMQLCPPCNLAAPDTFANANVSGGLCNDCTHCMCARKRACMH